MVIQSRELLVEMLPILTWLEKDLKLTVKMLLKALLSLTFTTLGMDSTIHPSILLCKGMIMNNRWAIRTIILQMHQHHGKSKPSKMEIRSDIKDNRNPLQKVLRSTEESKKLCLHEQEAIVTVLEYLEDNQLMLINQPSKFLVKDTTWTIYLLKLLKDLSSSSKQLLKMIYVSADLANARLTQTVYYVIRKYAIKFSIRKEKPTTPPHTDK
jgi:hypothetical protein